MPGLAKADLLGVSPSFPTVTFISANTNAITYDPLAQAPQFQINAEPVGFEFSPTASGIVINGGSQGVVIEIGVDNNGNLVSGTAGFSLEGQMAGVINGVTVDYPDGTVLLEGDVYNFGFAAAAPEAAFDFRVNVTGGALAAYFSCSDLAIYVLSEYSTFTNSFTTAFNGSAKGQLVLLC
jgi:hypothetical protein